MSDDDDFTKERIPPHVRAMLEPFRRIGASEHVKTFDDAVHVHLVPTHDRPSYDQLAAIGLVASNFSILERVLGLALTRLALAPDFPALALSKEIGVNYSLKAMEKLLALHRERYIGQIASFDLLDVLDRYPTKIRPLKDQRDIVVHTVWMRAGKDRLIGLRPRPLTESAAAQSKGPEYDLKQLHAIAADIEATANELFVLAQLLPEVDESLHVKSLVQKTASRRQRDRSEP